MRRSHVLTLAHWSLAFAASFAVHAVALWLLVQGYHPAQRSAIPALQISLVQDLGETRATPDLAGPERESDAPGQADASAVGDTVPVALRDVGRSEVALPRPQMAFADLVAEPFQPPQPESIAEVAAVQAPASTSSTRTAAQAAQMEWQVANWLERYRTYPRAARRAGYEGTAWVRFTLDRRGRLQRSELVDSSGYGLLDRAAMELLDRASPFPALPSASGLDEIELLLPIEYRLMAAVGG